MASTTNQYKIKSICRGSFIKEYGEYSVVTEASKPTKILNPEGVEVFTCGVADPLSAVQLFLAYENPFNKRPHLDSGRVVKFFQLGDSTDFTFTIVPTPSDAITVINDVERTTITADKGTEISWKVSKTGYADSTGTYTLNASKTENVTLTPNQYAFTIVPTPDDATVTINSQEVSTLDVDFGSEVTWSVAKEGYHSQSGTYTMTAEAHTENVTLVALVNYYAWTANDLTLYTLSETPETTDKLFTFSDNEMVESETYSISAFADSTLTVSDGSDTTDLARDSEADKSL